mmetsp:Transcript_156350/g.501610  ORF Transcript_156350/g.501610 Transcript_156350/m.501610 type:complete len:104 (+) Transcript_156350:428-739(+)
MTLCRGHPLLRWSTVLLSTTSSTLALERWNVLRSARGWHLLFRSERSRLRTHIWWRTFFAPFVRARTRAFLNPFGRSEARQQLRVVMLMLCGDELLKHMYILR